MTHSSDFEQEPQRDLLEPSPSPSPPSSPPPTPTISPFPTQSQSPPPSSASPTPSATPNPSHGCSYYTDWYADNEGPWIEDFSNFVDEITTGDNRVLVLSNAAETFRNRFGIVFQTRDTQEVLNLYKAEVALQESTTRKFRLWFWHLNSLAVPVNFGIVVSATNGATASITNVRRHIETGTSGTGDLSVPGVCLATRQMARDLDSGTGMASLTSEQPLPSSAWAIASNKLLAGIIEFDVQADADCDFRVRFYANRGAGTGSWNTRVWGDPAEQTSNPARYADDLTNGTLHIRGWWPHSNFEATDEDEVFDLNDPSPGAQLSDVRHITIVPVGGVGSFGSSQPSDPYGTVGGNKGLVWGRRSLPADVDKLRVRATPNLFANRCPELGCRRAWKILGSGRYQRSALI
ncbi:hypothetical protein QPK87_19155 [Kamptonema cortianum]|nr:hypothetical protein [Geitlerinema splendidum]MDK3158674.1 hypothetical protein [Kamptonema cortianum]